MHSTLVACGNSAEATSQSRKRGAAPEVNQKAVVDGDDGMDESFLGRADLSCNQPG